LIVVADSSPLNYLLLIGEEKLLVDLYGAVTIPSAVHQELTATGAPERIRDWANALPSWVTVKSVVVPQSAALAGLDEGEAD
jgi:predicted nucleic acid-binding protein